MIDKNNPEININELMQKVRDEVARRKNRFRLPVVSTFNIEASVMDWKISHIQALLRNAESRAIVRTKWPDNLNRFPFNLIRGIQKIALKILNFIFKDQREVNFNVINALKESTELNRQLIAQVETLRSQLDEQLSTVATPFDELNERLSTVHTHIEGLSENLSLVNTRIQGMDDRWDTINSSTNSRMSDIQKRLDAVDSRVQRIDEHLDSVNTRVQGQNERYIRNDTYLKNDLSQQKRLLTLFLEEAQQRLPQPLSQDQLQTFVNENQHSLDGFYAAFEDRFRGTREEITKKLKVYLPIIAEAQIGTQDSPILDVGCGRGEWLELIRESGYIAKGIDINRVMVEQCQARELEVIESDAIAYLQSLPDASLGAVTGFHIIEHLPFPLLIKLFNEVARVLKTNGLAIFETPNPQNLLVGACDFYSDPTHLNPLHPEMIQFLLNYQGLSNVQLLYLNPVENSPFDQEAPGMQTLRNWFFGPRDYAVVGYKI
ncbi:methyltransferase domain-containing protein [Mastigocladopsis repens]|uniref:methyltransferase domain-containing protein n=1 Tax=Mastigocladopsis repens TaxID=221287 RepID=UPI0003096695|nr:methyltransferase domain-containing protein [Mastigocladopsis repens]